MDAARTAMEPNNGNDYFRIGEDLRVSAPRPLRTSGSRSDDPAPKVQLPYGVKLVSGASGWYHDEAILSAAETDRGRKN